MTSERLVVCQLYVEVASEADVNFDRTHEEP